MKMPWTRSSFPSSFSFLRKHLLEDIRIQADRGGESGKEQYKYLRKELHVLVTYFRRITHYSCCNVKDVVQIRLRGRRYVSSLLLLYS